MREEIISRILGRTVEAVIMKNIVLIGYRCTGKSSAGNILATRLRRPFWDTDGMIIEQSQMSIDEIVSRYGWDSFRMREKEIVRKVSR
ncbi:MAG TPA: hypothetical protein ENN86_01985, partial [Desulfobacteraceae bacterium]|nr:hypothetical protein [Desulfobacteraceae bacterium]